MSPALNISERATCWAKLRSWTHLGVQIWSLSKSCSSFIHKVFVKKSKIIERCQTKQSWSTALIAWCGNAPFPWCVFIQLMLPLWWTVCDNDCFSPREERITLLQWLSTAAGWVFWGTERTLRLLHSQTFLSGEKIIYLAKAKFKHIEVNWNCSPFFFFGNRGVQFFWHIWIFSIQNSDVNHLTSVPQVRQERRVLPWKAVLS